MKDAIFIKNYLKYRKIEAKLMLMSHSPEPMSEEAYHLAKLEQDQNADKIYAMLQKIDKDVSIFLLKAEVRQNIERKAPSKKQITNEKEEGVKKTPKKSQKIGRNDPCPCGSGKKYKQCCGK